MPDICCKPRQIVSHRQRRYSRLKPLPRYSTFLSWLGPCGSGHAREADDAVDGTGCAGVRG